MQQAGMSSREVESAPAVVARAPRLELVIQRPAVAAAGLAAEVVGVREDAQEAHQAVQLACRRGLGFWLHHSRDGGDGSADGYK